MTLPLPGHPQGHQNGPKMSPKWSPNAGGFQWLNEAARQAKRHAVLAPHLLATTGLVTDQARFGQWLPIDMAKQIFLCLVRLHILAAEDKAVADPVL